MRWWKVQSMDVAAAPNRRQVWGVGPQPLDLCTGSLGRAGRADSQGWLFARMNRPY